MAECQYKLSSGVLALTRVKGAHDIPRLPAGLAAASEGTGVSSTLHIFHVHSSRPDKEEERDPWSEGSGDAASIRMLNATSWAG